jgi:hypothetical protein
VFDGEFEGHIEFKSLAVRATGDVADKANTFLQFDNGDVVRELFLERFVIGNKVYDPADELPAT